MDGHEEIGSAQRGRQRFLQAEAQPNHCLAVSRERSPWAGILRFAINALRHSRPNKRD